MYQHIKIVAFAFLLLFSAFVYSQIKVSGKAPFAAKQTLRIQTYEDLISYKITTLVEVEIDKNGNFSFEINSRQPIFLFFVINYINSQIILEPNKSYNLTLSVDSIFKNPTEISVREIPMWIEINQPNAPHLMSLVVKLEDMIEDFLIKNHRFNRIYFHRERATYDSLITLLNMEFKNVENPYFVVYKKHRIGQIDNIMRSKLIQDVFNDYFTDIEIHYNNLAYMQFFNDFFQRYIQSPNSIIPKEQLYVLINNKPNYLDLLNFIGKDPILVNEKIRELVLIKNLSEMYKTNDFNKSNILYYLLRIAETTKLDEHRKIANNVVESLTKFETGFKPSVNELISVKGEKFSIESFRGKPLFIHFFSVDCIDCIKEMYAIQKIRKDFEGKMNFISVSMDVNKVKLFHFINRFPQFDWPFFSFGNNYDWVVAYDIKSFPANVLLDDESRILLFQSSIPKGELSRFLYAYFMEDYRPKQFMIPGSSMERRGDSIR